MELLLQLSLFVLLIIIINFVMKQFGKRGFLFVLVILFASLITLIIGVNGVADRSFWLIILFASIPLSIGITQLIKKQKD
uniref:YesK-like protein n=1 Tax=Halalkalibacterium halodurans TaxID=86665 RepID=A0A0M0KEF2_ALKHA